jgi:hypothetical protein
MPIETTSFRRDYDQDGKPVPMNWPYEQHMPRISASFHGVHGAVTIAYDLAYTSKRLSHEGRMLIHAIFLAASGEQHHDSTVFGLCAGAEEGEDQHISVAQADAVATAIAAVIYRHMLTLVAWQREGIVEGTYHHIVLPPASKVPSPRPKIATLFGVSS